MGHPQGAAHSLAASKEAAGGGSNPSGSPRGASSGAAIVGTAGCANTDAVSPLVGADACRVFSRAFGPRHQQVDLPLA